MTQPADPRAVFVRDAVLERSWADRERNLQELIFDATRAALDDSGVAFADIDSVVLSAHDMVDGRSLSSMVSAPAAGAYLRDEIRLGEDGASAFAAATFRVAAGLSNECIVCAWGRASEGDPERIANALFDPFFSQPLGMTEIAVSAMRSSMALRAFDAYPRAREKAARRRQQQASRTREGPPIGSTVARPLPLLEAELPRWCDAVCAMVLTSQRTDLRVAGVGMSSESYWPGDRDLLRLAALEEAAGLALAEAGATSADMDVLELDGLTLFDEALAVEAVGAAVRGEGMTAIADSDLTNAAGGYAQGYCAPVMGLARIAEAAGRLRSRGSGRALASGGSSVAGQTQAALVLEVC